MFDSLALPLSCACVRRRPRTLSRAPVLQAPELSDRGLSASLQYCCQLVFEPVDVSGARDFIAELEEGEIPTFDQFGGIGLRHQMVAAERDLLEGQRSVRTSHPHHEQ